uniref:Neur_chan_LBD domain-containing protein n=1 Tax=Ascaris lumbricoides TaxID=6252 RepID=A0A0M3INA1_ASCLU
MNFAPFIAQNFKYLYHKSRNSINLGHIIESLLKDYDVHLLPEAEGVNVTIENSINLGHIIESLLKDYDVHLLPEAEGVNVTIELHVQGISGISEITGDFELDIMYSEIWQDPRLSFKHLNVCATNITLKSDFRKKIWTPDTCIINSKDSSIHTSPSENTFIILYEHGLLWSNFR